MQAGYFTSAYEFEKNFKSMEEEQLLLSCKYEISDSFPPKPAPSTRRFFDYRLQLLLFENSELFQGRFIDLFQYS